MKAAEPGREILKQGPKAFSSMNGVTVPDYMTHLQLPASHLTAPSVQLSATRVLLSHTLPLGNSIAQHL